jgi:hypothetical protein
MNHPFSIRLATSRFGRIVLHAICLMRHPDNARWHCDGILREVLR